MLELVEGRTDMTDQTLSVMDRFNDALALRDIEGLLAAMTEDTVFENTSPAPDGTRLQGIPAMRKFFTELFEANPGARFDVEEQFAAGDCCVVRCDWGAGHVRGVDIIRLRDGLIAETFSYVKG
jgi:ketosteroid isomerase-like protein